MTGELYFLLRHCPALGCEILPDPPKGAAGGALKRQRSSSWKTYRPAACEFVGPSRIQATSSPYDSLYSQSADPAAEADAKSKSKHQTASRKRGSSRDVPEGKRQMKIQQYAAKH